jgi:hypothetical protein
MSELVEVRLGVVGLAYVETCLRQGTGLCSKVLERGLTDGTVIAPLPPSTSSIRAASFDTGGILSRKSSIAWFEQHLREFAITEPNCVLVVQDVWAKPTDPALQKKRVNSFTNGNEVYYFSYLSSFENELFGQIIRQVSSYLVVAFLSRARISFTAGSEVDLSLIEEISRSVKEVVVSAYDQEGFVLWQRQDGHS